MTSAWNDYVAAARDLSRLRAADEARHAELTERAARQREELDSLRTRLAEQRTAIETVAGAARLPVPPPSAAAGLPSLGGVSVDDAIRDARADTEAADGLVTETDYLAHRAPLLPSWRGDERNALIYGAFAVLALIAQMGMLVYAKRTEDTMDLRVTTFLVCAAVPFAAFALGWLSIGVVARPRLGGGEPPVRNPRLGLVICLSTWVLVCMMGGTVLF